MSLPFLGLSTSKEFRRAFRFHCLRALTQVGLAGVLLCGESLLVDAQVSAQTPQASSGAPAKKSEELELTRRANSIARQTMSPFCPGRTLADCPSPNAAAWRADIRELLAEGRSAGEIQREFERRTGGDLSGIPNREVSYTFPIALTVGAAGLLLLVFSGMVRGKKSSQAALKKTSEKREVEQEDVPAISDERLAEELEKLD